MEVIKEIKEGNAPSEWLIGPGSSPSNLQTVLLEEGFRQEYHMTGMAVDLNKICSSDSIAGLDIRTINSIDLLLRQGIWNITWECFKKECNR